MYSHHPTAELMPIAFGQMPRCVPYDAEQAVQIAQLATRMQQWQARLDFYADIPHYAKYTRWWQESSQVRKRLLKLHSQLAALHELNRQEGNIADRKEINAVILRMMDVTLTKLELNQLRKLASNQEIARDEIASLQQAFQQKDLALEAAIDQKKYSERFTAPHTKRLYILFKRHEQFRIRIKQFKDMIVHGGKATAVASASTNVFTTVQTALPTAIGISQTALQALSAIPILNSIAASVPVTLNAARAWMANQSKTKKTVATGLVCLFVGAIIVGGLLPVAAAGIAVGLIGTGLVIEHVIPWWQTRKAIKQKEQQLETLAERFPMFISGEALYLTEREKQVLLKNLETYCAYCIKEKIVLDPQAINMAKNCILAGNSAKIRINPLFNQMLDKDRCSGMEVYLMEETLKDRVSLEKELVTLRALRNKKIAYMINGGLTLVGAVLLCIPTPPTMIAGAALLAATTLAGIAIKYNLVSKTKKWLKNLMTGNNTDKDKPLIAKNPLVFETEPQNSLRESPSAVIAPLHRNSSVEVLREIKPAPLAPANPASVAPPSETPHLVEESWLNPIRRNSKNMPVKDEEGEKEGERKREGESRKPH